MNLHPNQYPDLKRGRPYSRHFLGDYIAPQPGTDGNDFDLVRRKLSSYRFGTDRELWRPQAEMLVVYEVVPLSYFASDAGVIWNNLLRPGDRERVDKIKALVCSGRGLLPVWVDFRFYGDNMREVCEGNHRLRAFTELRVHQIPIFICFHDLSGGSPAQSPEPPH